MIRPVAVALLSFAAMLSPRSGLQAQRKRPMAINDLFASVRVADPQLSPDGRTVLYVRTTTELAAGRRSSSIWSVSADGSGSPKEFIAGSKGDNSPRFLPDGRVAFISSRGGAAQVYLADADGSNARTVTAISGGVAAPLVVSPDGREVAFISDVYPACADDACNKRVRDSLQADPVKVHVLTRLPFRHWDEWWDAVRHHVFVADIASGMTRDLTPGDADSPPNNFEDASIAFSPDSREIAFVSKRGAGDSEMWTTNHDIWIVPVGGGTITRVTANPAADLQPVYSPDGTSIIVRAQRRPGFESDRWYLDVYDRATHSKRTVFESPDLSVDDFHLSQNGRTILFTAADHGLENLYQVPTAGGTPTLLAKGGAIAEVAPGAGFTVYAKSTMTAPTELFRVTDGGVIRQLTHENAAWLAAADIPAPTSTTVSGAGGASVQYWLLKPPGFDTTRRYPVVFMIHGGPQGDWPDGWSYRWNPALWAAQGWIVVAPNPRGSTGFGQAFVDQISQDWCGKAMTDLNAVFNAVAELPYADSTRMGIAGASYGGYAVDWIIGHTNRFKVAVSHDGVFNLESMALATDELWFSEWEFGGPPWRARARANFARCSPHLSAARIRTPTLVVTNEQDFRVPVDQGLQLFTALRRNGIASEGMVFPDEGHWVLKPRNSERWHETVFAWIRKYLDQ